MSKTAQPEVLATAFNGGHSPWVVILAALGATGCLLLVVSVLREPEVVVLSDDLSLSQFVWVPGPGPWLGVDLQLAGGPEGARAGAGSGVFVSRVMRDSPAQAAGLRAGDRIVGADGRQIDRPLALSQLIAKHKVGEVIPLTVERGGRQLVLRATLGNAPTGGGGRGRLAAATVAAKRAWLGVDLQPVDQLMVQQLGLPDTRGVIVSYVHVGSPAAAAGLAQGDVIRRVGDLRVRSIKQLDELVSISSPGDALRLVCWHAGVLSEVRVVLAERPPPRPRDRPPLPGAEVEIEAAWLGLDIVPLSGAEARELGLPAGSRGMVVDGVAPGPGVDAGLQVGDVIVAVNGEPTTSIARFKEATEGAVGALVDVVRFGRHIYITVPAPEATAGTGGAGALRQVFFGWP